MWPGVGGIVDALLFLGILIAGEKRNFVSSLPYSHITERDERMC